MKIKILLMAALIGAAAMSANAGVRFGVSVGLPLPSSSRRRWFVQRQSHPHP
jgi:hypothetical protein